ncbi:MAG: hypothetical protein JWL86_6760 [Rhizobium sp.]|nr:hypothetical protein [Rhizobium sp.]
MAGFRVADIGVNVSPETGMDKGYSEGFISDFESAAARDAYLIHPEHQSWVVALSLQPKITSKGVGAWISKCAEFGP